MPILIIAGLIVIILIIIAIKNKIESDHMTYTGLTAANRLISSYRNFLNNKKYAYVTKNKYCIFDNLILVTFFARNQFISHAKETVDEFTNDFFHHIISFASTWAWIGIDKNEAKEMFFNRMELYNEIFCKPGITYEKKIESCVWELVQLIKYDIAYESYYEYSSSSAILVTGFMEDQLIEMELFALLKGVSEKL